MSWVEDQDWFGLEDLAFEAELNSYLEEESSENDENEKKVLRLSWVKFEYHSAYGATAIVQFDSGETIVATGTFIPEYNNDYYSKKEGKIPLMRIEGVITLMTFRGKIITSYEGELDTNKLGINFDNQALLNALYLESKI